MSKFNGHRDERRNLTDILLRKGADGRARPKSKKKSKPKVPKMTYGGPSPVNSLLQLLQQQGQPGYTRQGNMPIQDQALMQYLNAAQIRGGQGLGGFEKANYNADFAGQRMNMGDEAMAQGVYQNEFLQQAPQAPQGTSGMSVGLPGLGAEVLNPQASADLSWGQSSQIPAQAAAPMVAPGLPSGQSAMDSQSSMGMERVGNIDARHAIGQGVTKLLDPGQVPAALGEHLKKQGQMGLLSSAGQTVGSFISQNSETIDDPMAKFGFGEGVGAAISGATNPFAMSLGLPGMIGGAALGVGKQIFEHQNEKNEFLAAQREETERQTEMNVGNAKQFSDQALSTYTQSGVGGSYYGRYGGPLKEYYNGGPANYETEKNEMIIASPNDPPIAMGQGGYKKISQNLYKANGPSHANGGIPTRGATQPFVDSNGQQNDSPYVFSDSKDMRIDPTPFLNF